MTAFADHPRCATCAHWTEAPGSGQAGVGAIRESDASVDLRMGACRAASHRGLGWGGDGPHWVDGDDALPVNPPTAAVIDADDYVACLLTRHDHYCPMHSALTPG